MSTWEKKRGALEPVWVIVNVAVTFIASFITMGQEVLVPLHAPLQPEKVDPGIGMAVRVTLAPLVIDALQVDPQLIQLDDEVTVPLPLPSLLTVSENEPGMVVVVVVVTYVVVVVGGMVVVTPIPALHGISYNIKNRGIINTIKSITRFVFIAYPPIYPRSFNYRLKDKELENYLHASFPAIDMRVFDREGNYMTETAKIHFSLKGQIKIINSTVKNLY